MRKTTAYRNRIKNSELETREVFERETENISLTRQPDLVTILHDNPLTQPMDSSKDEETHKPEMNPDPEPSLSDSSKTSSLDSRAKKKKIKKKKKRRNHHKDDSSDPSLSDDSDYSDDSYYRRKRCKKRKH